jgi:DNA end-binding protein Ku
MAAIWKGTISFGLVSIPVELRSAVRADRLSFRLLHSTDLAPVKYERVCERDGSVVPWREVVKGYEYAKGKFVVLTDEEFKAAAIGSSSTLDILDFVQAEEIDPRYFDTPYYLTPAHGGEKAYALLREAIRETDSVGIGKLTMRQRQHLAAIKTSGVALVLETMRFANELVDVDALDFPSSESIRPQELQMATQLISNLAEHFDPTKYSDDYRASLMKVIRAKMKGQKIEAEESPAPESTKVIDLMTRLQESLEQSASVRRAKRESQAEASADSNPRGSRRGTRSRRRETA